MKKQIFVTGSTGFIGRNFVEQFSAKYQLLTPSHIELDLLDSNAVDKFFSKNKIDVVLHLANKGGNQKEIDFDSPLASNLKIFFNLANNQDKFKKMIYLGSGAEYGKQFPIVKVKESNFASRVPEDDFGLYKFIAAKYAEGSAKIINLRTFGIYGKYEDWRFKLISNTICKVLYKKPVTIENNCLFDYIYINDLLKIVDYFILHKPKFNSYNIGAGAHFKLSAIAQKVVSLSKSPIPIVIKNKHLGAEYTCNNQRLQAEMKTFKWTHVNESLNELFSWYRENLSTIDKNQLKRKRKEIWKATSTST